MNRFRAIILASLAWAISAHAAEVTRVASSFEDKKPFGMFLDLGFERTQERGLLTRESHQGGDLKDVNEVRYTGVDNRFTVDAHIGLYKDLELHYQLPLVLSHNETWQYAAGTDASNSTIANNCLNADGSLTSPGCPGGGGGASPLFPVPNDSYRGGLGNMTFGVAYALFNQTRDDTKATWVVGMDYEAPTANRIDPSVRTSSIHRGGVGDRVHKYKLFTALSRKYGFAEPYFKAHYTIPYPGSNNYSNCEHPSSSNMSRPDNCSTAAWSHHDTGIQPPNEAGILFGTELSLFEQQAEHNRVALDFQALTNYVSAGRYYNEMAYLFGKLLSSEDYLQVGGSLGLTLQAADYITFKAIGALAYNTSHGVTNESTGKDLNGNGTVSLDAGSPEANPNYDYRVDASGRRFRISQNIIFRLNVMATFNF